MDACAWSDENMALRQEIERLRAERDEAREAARWVFMDGDDMSNAMRASAIEQWPWLEVSDERV